MRRQNEYCDEYELLLSDVGEEYCSLLSMRSDSSKQKRFFKMLPRHSAWLAQRVSVKPAAVLHLPSFALLEGILCGYEVCCISRRYIVYIVCA